jgi:hypothetical protein
MRRWAWPAVVVLGVACVGAAGGAVWLLTRPEPEPVYASKLGDEPTPAQMQRSKDVEETLKTTVPSRLKNGDRLVKVECQGYNGYLWVKLHCPSLGGDISFQRVWRESSTPHVTINSKFTAADASSSYDITTDWQGKVLREWSELSRGEAWESQISKEMRDRLLVILLEEGDKPAASTR